MALDPWVDDLDAYCEWVRDQIAGSGGHLIAPSAGEPHFDDGFAWVTQQGDEFASLAKFP
jgi:hypothetical protein